MFLVAIIVIVSLLVILAQLLLNYQTRGQGMRLKKDPLQHRIALQNRVTQETVDKVRESARPKLQELEDRIDEFTQLRDHGASLLDELVQEGHDLGVLVIGPEGDEESGEVGDNPMAVEDAITLAFQAQEEKSADIPAIVLESRASLEELGRRLTEMDRDVEIVTEALYRLEALADENEGRKESEQSDA